MAFTAKHPERYLGTVVGNGHCVAFVREASQAPHTSLWIRGTIVATTDIPTGTAIATFDHAGKYANKTDGSSHAAIFVRQHGAGISVWDQWIGHPCSQRVIRWKDGAGDQCDDASRYYVIESDAVPEE